MIDFFKRQEYLSDGGCMLRRKQQIVFGQTITWMQ